MISSGHERTINAAQFLEIWNYRGAGAALECQSKRKKLKDFSLALHVKVV